MAGCPHRLVRCAQPLGPRELTKRSSWNRAHSALDAQVADEQASLLDGPTCADNGPTRSRSQAPPEELRRHPQTHAPPARTDRGRVGRYRSDRRMCGRSAWPVRVLLSRCGPWSLTTRLVGLKLRASRGGSCSPHRSHSLSSNLRGGVRVSGIQYQPGGYGS